MAKDTYKYAIGRRKTASATVRLYSVKGESTVNDKPLNEYFPTEMRQGKVWEVFKAINEDTKEFYLTAKVQGGGVTAQAEAIQLGLARILVDLFPDKKPEIKAGGYLTRDPRMVERKKTGLRKARKREQFSKR